MSISNKRIGLSLSGGGIRAIMFHLGVLRFLAENKLLENIKYISTVSGGSILVGLIFKYSNNSWPTSEEFLINIHPKIKKIILEKNLQLNSFFRILFSTNWFDRSKGVRDSIEFYYGIDGKIEELPEKPVWAINCTTYETSNRWRIKSCTMGDYEIGYANMQSLKIADAITMSAAFPGLIGSYKIKTKDYDWYNYKTKSKITIKYKAIHILDGGVYDNLGLEPIVDPSKQKIKEKNELDCIILSDATQPLVRKNPSTCIRFFKNSLRIIDLIYENVRKLRTRIFVAMLAKNQNGILVRLGMSKDEIEQHYRQLGLEIPNTIDIRINNNDIDKIRKYKTSLWKPSKKNYDIIEQHGYITSFLNYKIFTHNNN